ncbi:7157_t:CDS:2, partial [Diversispora eburnea]
NEISEYGRIKLLRGADPKKDQSYFLSAVLEEKFRNKPFSEFLEQYLIGQLGDIKTLDGQHKGQHAYTIGQRVQFLNCPSNPMFFSNSLIAKDWCFFFDQIRYRQDPDQFKVQLRSDNKYFVEFKEPQWTIAPGQISSVSEKSRSQKSTKVIKFGTSIREETNFSLLSNLSLMLETVIKLRGLGQSGRGSFWSRKIDENV